MVRGGAAASAQKPGPGGQQFRRVAGEIFRGLGIDPAPQILHGQAGIGLDENGQQTLPNPSYGQPTAFQPPQAVRIGMEFAF